MLTNEFIKSLEREPADHVFLPRSRTTKNKSQIIRRVTLCVTELKRVTFSFLYLTKPITLRDTSHRTLTHVTSQGQEKPVPCEGGTFQEQTGHTDCIPCPAGKFCNPEPGACVLYLTFPLISLHLILYLTFIKHCCPHNGDDYLMLFQSFSTLCNLLLSLLNA